jgi:hypothetical protein
LIRLFSFFAAVGISYYLAENFSPISLEKPWSYLFPITAGAFLWSSFATFRYAARKFQEARLLGKVNEFRRWKDGERIAVQGTLQPSGDLLKSPFTNRDCVAYKYKITHSKRRSDGKHYDVVDYEGYGLTRSHIETATGNVRLLGFPMSMNQINGVGLK